MIWGLLAESMGLAEMSEAYFTATALAIRDPGTNLIRWMWPGATRSLAIWRGA